MILRLTVVSLANIAEVALAVAHVRNGNLMTHATAYLGASGANCSNDTSPCCYKLENAAKKIILESCLVNRECGPVPIHFPSGIIVRRAMPAGRLD